MPQTLSTLYLAHCVFVGADRGVHFEAAAGTAQHAGRRMRDRPSSLWPNVSAHHRLLHQGCHHGWSQFRIRQNSTFFMYSDLTNCTFMTRATLAYPSILKMNLSLNSSFFVCFFFFWKTNCFWFLILFLYDAIRYIYLSYFWGYIKVPRHPRTLNLWYPIGYTNIQGQ